MDFGIFAGKKLKKEKVQNTVGFSNLYLVCVSSPLAVKSKYFFAFTQFTISNDCTLDSSNFFRWNLNYPLELQQIDWFSLRNSRNGSTVNTRWNRLNLVAPRTRRSRWWWWSRKQMNKHNGREFATRITHSTLGRNSVQVFSNQLFNPIRFVYTIRFCFFFRNGFTSQEPTEPHTQRCADIFFLSFFGRVFTYLHMDFRNWHPTHKPASLFTSANDLLLFDSQPSSTFTVESACASQRIIQIREKWNNLFFAFLHSSSSRNQFNCNKSSILCDLFLGSTHLCAALCKVYFRLSAKNAPECKSIVIFHGIFIFSINFVFSMPSRTHSTYTGLSIFVCIRNILNRKRTNANARSNENREKKINNNILVCFDSTTEAVRNRPRSAREKNNETSESCYVLLYTENYQISRRVPFYMCHVISSSSLCTQSA